MTGVTSRSGVPKLMFQAVLSRLHRQIATKTAALKVLEILRMARELFFSGRCL